MNVNRGLVGWIGGCLVGLLMFVVIVAALVVFSNLVMKTRTYTPVTPIPMEWPIPTVTPAS